MPTGGADMTAQPGISALLVGDFEFDLPLVHRVFSGLGWTLFAARGRDDAIRCLESHTIHVVLLQNKSADWNWKNALWHLRSSPLPAQLVVASHHADETLWCEVLNEGGYDVLMQPLDPHELERVLASAHRYREDEAQAGALGI
jgi:DNA-binding NtrC family response regulator